MFWLVVSAILSPIGFIVYCILWPEVDKYESKFQNHILVLFIKIIYKWFKFSPGVLNIGNQLVYRAGATGADLKCSLRILPTNHKVVVTGIRLNKDHLASYKKLCGYDSSDSSVPICYPETLFFKQVLTVLASRKFCLSPVGMIHLRQTIKQHEMLEEYINTGLTGTTAVTEYRETERGIEVDIQLNLTNDSNICIWEGCVTLLSRGKAVRSRGNEHSEETDEFKTMGEVVVPGNTGFKYAQLSGDWNPIHINKFTSRLLGFKAPIAHGMWTLPRVLAIPGIFDCFVQDACERYSVDCCFKRPLFMPGTMVIKINNCYNKCCLKVEDKVSGVPHIIANIEKLK